MEGQEIRNWYLFQQLLLFSNYQCLFSHSLNASWCLLHLFHFCSEFKGQGHFASKCAPSHRHPSLTPSPCLLNPANPSTSSLPLASPIPISGESIHMRYSSTECEVDRFEFEFSIELLNYLKLN